MENKTLMTDFYELTMAQTYFNDGKKDEIAYFDIFFRKNPFDAGYTIAGGLEETIEYIKNFKFDKKEIEYLRGLGFNEDFLNYLANLKFKGDIYAVEDGTVVFPNEPVLTVTDMKHGKDARGSVGFFCEIGTEAFFKDLEIEFYD